MFVFFWPFFSGTSSKPPIFPISSPPIRPSNEDLPPFMKEFVLRRQQSHSSTSTPEAAKRRITQSRPQSAFIPRRSSSAQAEQSPDSSSASPRSDPNRRRSDFVSRYESLLNRCQAATKAVDELDLLRLQKSSANTSKNENEDVNVEDVIDVDDGDEDESVDFNEEEVLQRCQEFQKDYQERKSKKKQVPVPKPRKSITGRPLSEPPKPSVRTRSSSLTLHDKNTNNTTDSNTDLELQSKVNENPVFPKPILKKSSDDISFARPILKRKDSESSLLANNPTSSSSGGASASVVSGIVTASGSGQSTHGGGILKRKSVTDNDNAIPSIPKPDHVRIRSPSPDLDLRPILRSRNSSLGEEEFPQSILKRRNSQDDLIMDGDVSASAGTSGGNSR